ncbi:MAG: hypothetical protein OSJ24_03070 [Muribaculaceae bacterium]|nr:hypothetical protein [Muribaculaceae bacterium]
MKFNRVLTAITAAALMVSAPVEAAPKRKAKAKSKVTAEELMTRARQAFYDYNPELALESIEALRSDKKADTNAADSLESRVNRMSEMIQRVEDVAIIDSINVDREDFFRSYRLAPTAGRLLAPAELGDDFEAAGQTVVFMPEDGSFMIWGTDNGLVESARLTDGSWEEPVSLGDVLNAGGTANYPFQLADGTTLYYATDGDDSLGGLDIYISQRNRDGFAVPQNMGMPYNSPYDDYMLAIDEETGAGWFATDRNRLGDMVTIYVFIPSETRVNLDVDLPDLADRARIAGIASPLDDGQQALLERISRLQPAGNSYIDNTPDFIFPLPDGRVYTRWSDFSSPAARRLMENYVDAEADNRSDLEQLAALRAGFNPADKEAARRILALEKKVRDASRLLTKISNQVITAELQ